MTVQIYRSTDSSAPVLTGQVGKLTDLLNACLVTGYGSKSAAGWTRAFNGTNQRTFRNSADDGTGYYVYVDDAGPGAAGAREARARGYITQTALDTGTGQFPTSALLAIGTGAVVWRKSNTADSTARAWTLIADSTVFYLFVETGDQTS